MSMIPGYKGPIVTIVLHYPACGHDYETFISKAKAKQERDIQAKLALWSGKCPRCHWAEVDTESGSQEA